MAEDPCSPLLLAPDVMSTAAVGYGWQCREEGALVAELLIAEKYVRKMAEDVQTTGLVRKVGKARGFVGNVYQF